MLNGHYERDSGGLFGKHDNVRRYWEDALTRHSLRRVVRTLADRIYWGRSERLRVLDLGCGSGQGYELITSITARDASIYEHAVELVPAYMVGRYVGLDISEAMVAQARATYGEGGKFEFRVGDFADGLPVRRTDDRFHLYFSSYGSLSHINSEQLIALLAQIAEHAAPGAFVVLDLLGRYSYEWPCYWHREAAPGSDMWDYSMSYLPGECSERSNTWPMRYWSSEEVSEAVQQASQAAGRELRIALTFDRSLFVGRHSDTCEYNPQAPRVRRVVNRLHEANARTDLAELIVDYVPQGSDERLDRFFEKLHVAWNALVHFCLDELSEPDGGHHHMDQIDLLPSQIQHGIRTMDKIIDNVGWMEMGDVRANVIEPQLGYTLRGIEASMQEGRGFGHGLLVALEVGGAA